MNGLLTFLALVTCIVILLAVPDVSDSARALLVSGALAGVCGVIITRAKSDSVFLLRVFVGGLIVRMLVATFIYVYSLQEFFGGDAYTYDFFGEAMLKSWSGDRYYTFLVNAFTKAAGSGWGMVYFVAGLYWLTGRNMLATQLVNSVMGAAVVPLIYMCSQHIFHNTKVSRIAALFVAFYPSLVLWSAQGLKDGPLVFLLVVSMLATLKLGERFSVKWLAILVVALFGLLSVRFYIFYMVLAAIGGSFVLGMRSISAQSFLRQFIIIILLGLGLTQFGVLRYASAQFETYGNFEQLQRSRLDASRTAKSGFAKDVDVSTTAGAISTIPIGLVYLLFAPFPWQLASLRQSITLPEMLVWWASFPLLVLGLWFSIKYRLRQISPILIFVTMLTLAYSVFQGNVGTAYRQRAQLLVFYFIFVAVGFVLFQEKREEKRRQEQLARQEEEARRAAVAHAHGRPSQQNI